MEKSFVTFAKRLLRKITREEIVASVWICSTYLSALFLLFSQKCLQQDMYTEKVFK